MRNLIIGMIIGSVLTTVGVAGAMKIFDSGISVFQTTIKDIANK